MKIMKIYIYNKVEYQNLSTSDWAPYEWSINNVAMAEVMHTVLAYYQAGRTEEAYQLLKANILDFMYLGSSPANFGYGSSRTAVWSSALVTKYGAM